ncbi:Mu-like prophage protein gp16 [Bordetella ansorpii]|uniref:Mu-like prophage protein gp16 n=1 Tax=Bordetella ansorpii TaxID=288768 RepID=A0A157SVV7_9BORD|nr:regulatory protein GemA [Bordetella ansorpii]SAI74602.1 Mu-like prophage protein gp16 [Bordetella ansorpii]
MVASAKRADERQRLIRLVHIASRDLQLDRETYRVALMTATGKDSCSRMSTEELQRALDHFKRVGFKVRAKATPSRPLDLQAESRKIRALWLLLRELGAIKNPSEEALAAYVKRITGVDALQWITGQQAERLIESMKKWALRYLPAQVDRWAPVALDAALPDADRGRLQVALAKARARQTFDPMLSAWEQIKHITAQGDRPTQGKQHGQEDH